MSAARIEGDERARETHVPVQLPRVVEKDGQIYGGLMAEENVDAAGPDVMNMFDAETDRSLVCRVCGSLVAAAGEYPKAHWDWHETPNGA
ncbi:MAG: hypothetical protein JWO11_233 [Nocardioides sp.]|nr:hypothetical protein [Nocardioides sp.]